MYAPVEKGPSCLWYTLSQQSNSPHSAGYVDTRFIAFHNKERSQIFHFTF